jgi:hypothetical protein
MALCVIGFDAYFLNNPTQCFFSNTCTSDEFFTSSDLYNTNTLYSIKVPLIKGQLAAGALMFVLSVIYIIIFAITNYRISKNPSVPVATIPISTQYVPPFMNATYGTTSSENPVNQSYNNQPIAPPYNSAVETYTKSTVPKTQMICHNCRSRFQIATQQ